MKDRLERYCQETLGESGFVKIESEKKHIQFGFSMAWLWPDIQQTLSLMDWTFEQRIQRHVIKPGLKGHPAIKNVIVVASGKGGVGKSTSSVNLALSLQRQGLSVGILDADIYGPSVPTMLGMAGEHPSKEEDESMPPIIAHGMQSISLGYLLAEDSLPLVWRGPMATRALTQLFFHTKWDALDYLIIDMPPGTGDIPLTMVQKLPISAAVIVTTPQDIALYDVRKAYRMFNKVNVPVLGIIENMSSYTCPHCQQESALFGEGGAKRLMQEYETTVLGHLPLIQAIRESMDTGELATLFEDVDIAHKYELIATKMTAILSQQKKDYSMTFDRVIVE